MTSATTLSPHGFRGWEHAPMKQSEARILILQQWDRWIPTRPVDPGGPTGKDSLKFFHELQDTRSPLLDFQSVKSPLTIFWVGRVNWFTPEVDGNR